MSEINYVQHYTSAAAKQVQHDVKETAASKSLRLNTNTAYLAGRGDAIEGFNGNAEIKSKIGHGKLMGYSSDGTLLMKPRFAVSIQSGYVGRNDNTALTPSTLTGFGRLRGIGKSLFDVPHLDMAIGSDSGQGGFVLSAPQLTLVLDVVADPAGVTDSGEVIYHSSLVGTGEIAELYLVIDEDADQVRLPNVPDPQAFVDNTPPLAKAANTDKDVSWLQLPVGMLGDDVVQLTDTNLIDESRLLIQDSITVVMPVMEPESETELMDAVKALATDRGYTRVDHT